MENTFTVYAGFTESPPVQQSPNAETLGELYSEALQRHQQGQLQEATILYEQVLSLAPYHAGALHFLGMVAFAEARLDKALELISRSLQLCDTKAVYHNNFGVVLKELKRYEDAKDAFEKAAKLNPNYADALSNLGLISILLEEPDQFGEKYLKQALQLQPNHIDALRHLSELYVKNDLHAEAKPLLERLASLSPPDAKLGHQLACVAGECGDIEQARTHFRRAAALPGGQSVWRHKHLWYCPTVFENETQIEQYWSNLNRDLDEAIAEKRLYDWKTLAHEGFTHSFNLPHLDRCCKETLEKFTALFAPSFAHFEKPTWKPGEKIRVGFLVTPGHEGGFLRLCTGLIEQLDPEKFEVVLIYNETTQKRYENRFKRKDLVHVRYPWNFEQAVQTIKDAKCDVIYYWKVAADPWSFFLPMCRLAPLQCTSWSTHGTSGVGHIDYYVSWDNAELPDAQKHYTENLFHLATTPFYEPVPGDIPPPATRKDLKLPSEGALYFCPHRLAKYHPKFDEYLKGILERDPDGHVLILIGNPTSQWSKTFVERLRKNLGEVLFRRVILLSHLSVADYYRFISVSTVLLNSPIYSGEITAIDGFLYDVPCVSQTGPWIFQRYATAFYELFGIEGPAVDDRENYVEQALRLGTNAEYREAISRKIHANRDSFFENSKTVREWERFLNEAVSPKTPEPERLSLPVEFASVEQPVPMTNLDINVSYGCNLRCQYCTHFCSWMSGIVPLDELVKTFESWHHKVEPQRLIVVGGEPLLHPELETIFQEIARYWPKARIDLYTNGLLLAKRPGILPLLKDLNGYVILSRHFQQEQYLREFDTAVKLLRETGLPHTITASDRDWRLYYTLGEDGRATPYDSEPQRAWKNCHTKNGCPSLMENKLYKCAHMAWAALGYRKGILPLSWKTAEEYQPLEPDCTAREILSLLSTEAVEQCRICPEQYTYVSLNEKSNLPLLS